MEAQGLARAAYEDRLRFETLISDLSARFIKLPAIKVNQEIERALREVTEFFNADRCGILEVFGDQKVARLIHAWYAEGAKKPASARTTRRACFFGNSASASCGGSE